jgi:hypothetical protein
VRSLAEEASAGCGRPATDGRKKVRRGETTAPPRSRGKAGPVGDGEGGRRRDINFLLVGGGKDGATDMERKMTEWRVCQMSSIAAVGSQQPFYMLGGSIV